MSIVVANVMSIATRGRSVGKRSDEIASQRESGCGQGASPQILCTRYYFV